MPAGTMTAWRAMPRRLVIPAVLVSLAAGLGSLVAGADAARIAGSPAGPATPVTAYVANIASETVTPIATATNTAGPPINVGRDPDAIAITPACPRVPSCHTGPTTRTANSVMIVAHV